MIKGIALLVATVLEIGLLYLVCLSLMKLSIYFGWLADRPGAYNEAFYVGLILLAYIKLDEILCRIRDIDKD